LTVELQNNTKEEEMSQEEEAIELATYSNSQYTALSYVSIFETLSMQNEIYYMREKNTSTINYSDSSLGQWSTNRQDCKSG